MSLSDMDTHTEVYVRECDGSHLIWKQLNTPSPEKKNPHKNKKQQKKLTKQKNNYNNSNNKTTHMTKTKKSK